MALSVIPPTGLPAVGALLLGYISEHYGLEGALISASIGGVVIWYIAMRFVSCKSEQLETPVENSART